MSTQRYNNYYIYASRLIKCAERMMYLSAVIFLLNAFWPEVGTWNYWHIVLNFNTILLLLINASFIFVSWLNFTARGNKLAGSIDNAYGTALLKYWRMKNRVIVDFEFDTKDERPAVSHE